MAQKDEQTGEIQWKEKEVFGSGKLIKFEQPGDALILHIKAVRRQVQTKMGLMDLIDGISLLNGNSESPDGDDVSFFLTAGLKAYSWDGMIDMLVKVVYEGEQKNPASGRNFKAFKVFTA